MRTRQSAWDNARKRKDEIQNCKWPSNDPGQQMQFKQMFFSSLIKMFKACLHVFKTVDFCQTNNAKYKRSGFFLCYLLSLNKIVSTTKLYFNETAAALGMWLKVEILLDDWFSSKSVGKEIRTPLHQRTKNKTNKHHNCTTKITLHICLGVNRP